MSPRQASNLSPYSLNFGSRSTELSYVGMYLEPLPGLEPGSRTNLVLTAYKTAALPIELQGHHTTYSTSCIIVAQGDFCHSK